MRYIETFDILHFDISIYRKKTIRYPQNQSGVFRWCCFFRSAVPSVAGLLSGRTEWLPPWPWNDGIPQLRQIR